MYEEQIMEEKLHLGIFQNIWNMQRSGLKKTRFLKTSSQFSLSFHWIFRRRIYLATDDNDVLNEAEQKYSNYKWLYYQNGGMKSGTHCLSLTMTIDRKCISRSLQSFKIRRHHCFIFWLEIFECSRFIYSLHPTFTWKDFFVGTSSSQVGRMAYELMQTKHADAAKYFVSLDDPWYFP